MCADRSRKTCFVIMGFGKKTDFATGRTLNLDATYQNIIKPAAEDAGLVCMRADELAHSGLLDAPLYEQLLTADLVIADISTSNMNVLYELGVRHALRPYATIVIAEDNLFAAPFDVTTVNILRYRHMGEDIGYAEVQRFRKVLTERILELTSSAPPQLDSPVYTFLNNLTPPATAAATRGVAEAVALPDDSFAGRLDQAKEAQKRGDFATAKALLEYVRGAMKKEDPYVIQQLALVTYKSRLPTPLAALEEARELLLTLAPVTSNDTETLGLWGAVHKRLWELTKESAHLDEAVHAYERGFYLRNDYYNGINLAFILNVRAANAASRADAIADFVQAERVRREVLAICEEVMRDGGPPGDDKYWILATVAEAYLGVGDEANAEKSFQEAAAIASAGWMKESTIEQMDKLRALLANSPLASL